MGQRGLVSTLLIILLGNIAWGQTYWTRTYQIDYSDYSKGSIESITPTRDGNFIAAGNVIVKITPFGDTLWTKKFYSTSDSTISGVRACAIIPTTDGNFLIAGYLSGAGFFSIIQKIAPDGDTIWTRKFSGRSYAIAPAADGNFIVGGTETVKVSPNGELFWKKDFGEIKSIVPSSDGNLIIAGSKPHNDSHHNFTFLKIDQSGSIIWEKNLDPDNSGEVTAIAPAGNGQFILGGYLYSQNLSESMPDPSAVLIKIASNGDIVWMKRYGVNKGYDFIQAIAPARDGNFFAVGSAGGDEYYLKIKPNGDTLWTKTIHSNSTVFLSSVAQTFDGTFIVPGYSENIIFRCFVDDRDAAKGIPFTFKIPVPGDSLNFGYTPLAVPSGMSVSKGGTISWTPVSDSAYIQSVKYLVSDDYGTRDTLTFKIFVNYWWTSVKTLQTRDHSIPKNFKLTAIQLSSTRIKFTLPPRNSTVKIYNTVGKYIRTLRSNGTDIIWNTQNEHSLPACSGNYIAEIMSGNLRYAIPFSVMR